MKLAASLAMVALALPGICQAQSKAIDLPKLVAAFMVKPGSNPEWSMGADQTTPQIKWTSSGVESRPDCGIYISCRRGSARIRFNGKEMQQLQQRLEPALWDLFMTSTSPAKFGPEEIEISPSGFFTFDFKKAMNVKGFSLKQICKAGPAPMRQTAYEVRNGASRVYAVVNDSLGSGGASTSLSLFFNAPSNAADLCAEAKNAE